MIGNQEKYVNFLMQIGYRGLYREEAGTEGKIFLGSFSEGKWTGEKGQKESNWKKQGGD